jgi:hypothetical protein
VVLKQVIGLAGHNAIRLWEPSLLETQSKWIASVIQSGQRLIVEPWLEREIDFSVQLEMSKSGLKLCGYTGLINDRKGQYQANWAAANYQRRIPAKVAKLFREPRDICNRIHELYVNIISLLEEEFRLVGYRGPAGIDAFVYRTSRGEIRLKPMVEINPRCTMGRLTLELMKQVSPGSNGLFRLVTRANSGGFADFTAYAASWRQRFPLSMEGQPVSRIREGALCLNDPERAQVCLATFQIGRNLDALLAG